MLARKLLNPNSIWFIGFCSSETSFVAFDSLRRFSINIHNRYWRPNNVTCFYRNRKEYANLIKTKFVLKEGAFSHISDD